MFKFFPSAISLSLQSTLEEKELYETLCPTNPSKKYEYLQALKSSGLALDVMMMTYSHGNNIGNLHFLWKVANSAEDISSSQHPIERAKEECTIQEL